MAAPSGATVSARRGRPSLALASTPVRQHTRSPAYSSARQPRGLGLAAPLALLRPSIGAAILLNDSSHGIYGDCLDRPARPHMRNARAHAVVIVPQVACTRITLISSYDEVIDHSATELQRRMDAFLTMLADKEGTPQASYDSSKTFY